jgi:hypothetical protein
MKRRYALFAVIFAVSLLIGIQAVEIVDANPVNHHSLAIMVNTIQSTSNVTITPSFPQTTELSVSEDPGVGGFSVLVPSNVTLGNTFEVGLVALYANGYWDRNFTGSVSFSSSKGTISPSMSGAFTEGSWNGFINMSEAGVDIVIYVNDGNGHTGRSTPVSVYQMNPTPTSSANSTPTPSVPEFSFLSVIFLLAVASVSLVYIKRRKSKITQQEI